MNKRESIIDYALSIAKVIATRSQDPYRQVGVVILDKDNRIIATGYNGLAPGYNPPPEFWDNKEIRKPYMIHAEINALSYVKRNEGVLLVSTLKPCKECLLACIAHNIRTIRYKDDKAGLEESDKIAKLYGISFCQI